MLNEMVLRGIRTTLDSRPLVIEGANGSLGLSFAYVLKELNIRPSSILLTTNSSNPSAEWLFWRDRVTAIKSSEPSFYADRANWIRSQRQAIFVIYGAGYGRPNLFLSDPLSVIRANVESLLGYTEIRNISHFAYLSTSEVYSGHDGMVNEETPLTSFTSHPRAIYIESKRMGEAIVAQLISKKTKRAASYRIALAIAPRLLDSDHRVLADLIRSAITTHRVTLKGGASFVRQYQYGPNAAYKLLGSMVNGKSSLYNNAGSHVITLGELARSVSSLFNADLEIDEANIDDSAPRTVRLCTQRIDSESRYIHARELALKDYISKIINNAS